MVLTLSLGVGANTAVFVAARAILLDPAPYRSPDTLVILSPLNHFSPTPLVAADIPRLQQLHGLSNIAGCGAPSLPMLRDRPTILAAPIEVTEGFFSLLGVPPVLGRTLTAGDFADRQRTAVLSFELWKSMFGGDVAVVGRDARLDGARWTIVGVMPQSFRPSCFGIGGPVAWIPYQAATSTVAAYGMRLMARLTPGSSLAQADSERGILARAWASEQADFRLTDYTLEPINASRAAVARPGVVLLQSVAVLLLVVACTNIAGAVLLNASERRVEFALRVSLGATPRHLLRQTFAETSPVAVLGAALGAALALVVTRWLGPTAAPVLAGAVLSMDWRDVGAALALGGISLMAFALLPTLTAAYELGGPAGTARRPLSARRMRSTLLALQVGVTTVLLTGATVLLRSYHAVMSSSPGFQSDRLLTTDVYLSSSRMANASPRLMFKQAVTALSGAMADVRFVDACAFSDASPFVGGGSQRLSIGLPGAADAVSRSFQVSHVSSNYFSTLQIPIRRGRLFTETAGATGEAVVSEAFARMFGDNEVLGAVVEAPGGPLLVVGIVGDVKTAWLTNRPSPALYAPITLAAGTTVSVIARSGMPAQSILEMQKALERIDPDGTSVAVEALSTIVWRSERVRRFYLVVAVTFGVIAALVSAFGIFGGVGRIVASQSKAIAIRVALGASRTKIVTLVLVGGLRPVIVGVAAGLAGGFVLMRLFRTDEFLQTLIFSAASTNIWTYVLPLVLVLVSATLACSVPIKRALGLDPATTLKAQ